MNATLRTALGLCVVLPLAAGCAHRAAPFDQMDTAQFTVLRLQGTEPPPPPPAPAAAPPLIPGIPGLPIPPELQAAGQQILSQLPPGLVPPGLIPGQPAPQQPVPQPPMPRFPASAGQRGFIILASMPLTDESVKEEILDVFGDPDSFGPQRGNCFTPGMGIAIQRPNAPEADLLVSLSCNQAMGDGFAWPHPNNGFTPETHQKLTKIYEKLWGPVPPGS